MVRRVSGLMTVLVATTLALSGCTSTQDVLGTATYGLDGNVVSQTGVYPNIGAQPEVASEQLSDQEAANMKAELGALAAQRNGSAGSDASYRRKLAMMRELARNHSDEAAAEIEN